MSPTRTPGKDANPLRGQSQPGGSPDCNLSNFILANPPLPESGFAMIAPACRHTHVKKHGKDRYGNHRFRSILCGKTWIQEKPEGQLGPMRLPIQTAKIVLQLLLEGSSIRSTERITHVHRDTICRLVVRFGTACQDFLDRTMRDLTLTHLQFDEQWTFVAKKQARLTVTERAERCVIGVV